MTYQRAVPASPGEEQQKAEHEEDPTACDWPYSEHDWSAVETDDDGNMSGECVRCAADLSDNA